MGNPSKNDRSLTHADLLELKRLNTPTIYNGWKQITRRDAAADGFNIEECRDFMPQMGRMVGLAVTVQIEPSNPGHAVERPQRDGPVGERDPGRAGCRDRAVHRGRPGAVRR